MDVIRMLLVKCRNEWCVVLNHYDLGLYVESWWNPSWFPDYRDYGSLSTGIWSLRWLFFVLTFLWFGRFCYRSPTSWRDWIGQASKEATSNSSASSAATQFLAVAFSPTYDGTHLMRSIWVPIQSRVSEQSRRINSTCLISSATVHDDRDWNIQFNRSIGRIN